MLTRRKKLNLFYLCVGMVIGAAISALVMYFSVIANYTKERFVEIQRKIPAEPDSTKTVNNILSNNDNHTEKQQRTRVVSTANASQENAAGETETVADEEDETASPDEQPAVVIKSDVKVSDAIVAVQYLTEDTAQNVPPRKMEITVELWDNPTNFAGYRKCQNKLVVYGINIENIHFQMINDSLFLFYNNKKLFLKDTDEFMHYPAGFIK